MKGNSSLSTPLVRCRGSGGKQVRRELVKGMGVKGSSSLSKGRKRRREMTPDKPIKKRQKWTATSPPATGIPEEATEVPIVDDANKVGGTSEAGVAACKDEPAFEVSSEAPEMKLPRTDEEASAFISSLHTEADIVRFLEVSEQKAAKQLSQLHGQQAGTSGEPAEMQALHALLNCRRLVEIKLEMLKYDPSTSEPGTSEPGTSEPGTSDPGTSEPGRSVPESAAGSQRSVEELVQTASKLPYLARKELWTSITTHTEVKELLKHIDQEVNRSSKLDSTSSQPANQVVKVYSLRAEVESRLFELEKAAR